MISFCYVESTYSIVDIRIFETGVVSILDAVLKFFSKLELAVILDSK